MEAHGVNVKLDKLEDLKVGMVISVQRAFSDKWYFARVTEVDGDFARAIEDDSGVGYTLKWEKHYGTNQTGWRSTGGWQNSARSLAHKMLAVWYPDLQLPEDFYVDMRVRNKFWHENPGIEKKIDETTAMLERFERASEG